MSHFPGRSMRRGILFSILWIAAVSSAVAQEQTAPEAPEVPEAEKPVRIQKRLGKAPGRFQKSRYTLDRSEESADHRTLVLAKGVDKVVDLDPGIEFPFPPEANSVRTGNAAIVAVAPVGIGKERQLIFQPLEPGETSVTIRDKSGVIRIIFDVLVANQNQVRYYERLKENLKEVEGITISLEDKSIVIRGEVLTLADYAAIFNEIADKTYGEFVVSKVKMSNITLGILAKKIEQDLQTTVAQTVRVEVINGKIVLGGTVENADAKSRAFNRAYWYLPAARVKDSLSGAPNVEFAEADKRLAFLQNDIAVNAPPPKRDSKLVRMTVYFVELTKDFLKSFGFRWSPGFTADPTIAVGSNPATGVTTSGEGGFSFSATLSSLFPAISTPPSNASYGRVMKSGTVVVKSGEEGKMEDNIQIPTQTIAAGGVQGVGPTLNSAGFKISIRPTIMQGTDLDVDMDITQSNIVGKGASGTPITSNHAIKTRVYMKSGEVAAVAAVNKQDVSTSFNRDDPNPVRLSGGQGGPSTSPLFTLQRSKNMSKAKGQFVIFVTPLIIDNASDGTEDLKKNFRMSSSSR
jgi:pilus assembly protein CpaC